MRKVLALYSICGISGNQNLAYYIDSLRSLLSQTGFAPGELHVAVSSCLSLTDVELKLKDYFRDLITFNWIYESLPLPVTFNHTLQRCVEHFGAFDSYLYVDSGVNLWDPSKRLDALKLLYDAHKSGPHAITAAMPSNDDGREWWYIRYPEDTEELYTFPVGKTTNLHCQLYSEDMRVAYNGKLIPDIFANDSSESVTSFLTSAIHHHGFENPLPPQKFVMCQRVHVLHNQNMDGASIGWRGRTEDNMPLLFQTTKTMDQRYREGHTLGLGYEQCGGNERWLHDPDKFDEEGFARDPQLLEFLKNELFLKQDEFDYSTVTHKFDPGTL